MTGYVEAEKSAVAGRPASSTLTISVVCSRRSYTNAFAAPFVSTATRFVALLENVTPDVVLMDLKLPIMDGWETLREIRANPALANLPVVALTGYHSASVAHDVTQAGFTAYVPKPIDIELLNDTLAGLVG